MQTSGRPVTIVTGGSRGIGAATCRRLAGDGHDLVVGYLADDEAAGTVATQVRAAGARCLPVRVDTSDEAAVDRLFDIAAAELGTVTGLVNNAGVTGRRGPLAEGVGGRCPPRRGGQPVGLPVVLPPGRPRSARRRRRLHRQRVVSRRDPRSPGEYVHYAATKAAVDALTAGLAKELGPVGVRVNAVAPGVIETGMHAAMGDPDRPARLAPETPLRRPGLPDEIAAAISWLFSPDAAYATGTIVRVAGGR